MFHISGQPRTILMDFFGVSNIAKKKNYTTNESKMAEARNIGFLKRKEKLGRMDKVMVCSQFAVKWRSQLEMRKRARV